MEIFPKVEVKRLSKCEPGEIIRLPHSDAALAIVALADDERMLVTLSAYRGEPFPRYFLADGWRGDALCYGRDFAVELDQSHESVIVGGDWERSSTLTLTENRLLLSAQPLPGIGRYGTCFVDLRSGEMADQPASPYAVFTKWSLTVAGASGTRIRLASFG